MTAIAVTFSHAPTHTSTLRVAVFKAQRAQYPPILYKLDTNGQKGLKLLRLVQKSQVVTFTEAYSYLFGLGSSWIPCIFGGESATLILCSCYQSYLNLKGAVASFFFPFLFFLLQQNNTSAN